MRLFGRAIRRSGLDVAYSQGYNPRIRLGLVLPRPVGVASKDELLVLEMSDECQPKELGSRLAKHLPDGIRIDRCFELGPGPAPKAISSMYSLQLSPEKTTGLIDKIKRALAAEQLPVQRLSKREGKSRELDIRPYLKDMKIDGPELSFWLLHTQSGSAKPTEILALLDLDNDNNRAQLVREKTKYIGTAAIAVAE